MKLVIVGCAIGVAMIRPAVAAPLDCGDRKPIERALAAKSTPHQIQQCVNGKFGAPGVAVLVTGGKQRVDFAPAQTLAVFAGSKLGGRFDFGNEYASHVELADLEFKRYVGTSPGEYRKAAGRDNPLPLRAPARSRRAA